MKVLNVNHILETHGGGGTAERTLQMSYFLAEDGIDCQVISTDHYLSEETKNYLRKVKILAIPCLSKRFSIPKPMIFKVNRLVKSADIIHLMNHWTILNAWIYLNLKFYQKPYVVCPAGALPIFGRSKIIKAIYNILIGKRIIRNATYCIAVTESEIAQFLEYRVPRNKIKIIPNGIRITLGEPAEIQQKFLKKFDLENRPFILFVGRLNPIKGPDLLIQSFEKIKDQFPEYQLVIAGPDEGLLFFIQEFVKNHQMADRVRIIGPIGGEEKECAYQLASILVIPSRQEAMSIVVLEAGVYGTPAVFTDKCGLSMLSQEGCGVEVPLSVEGIADGISNILSRKAELTKISAKLKNYVSEHYDWKMIVKLYVNLYQSILKK